MKLLDGKISTGTIVCITKENDFFGFGGDFMRCQAKSKWATIKCKLALDNITKLDYANNWPSESNILYW